MALKNDFTTGNEKKLIIRFAIPLIISNFLQAFYNAVDMFFIGKFSGTVGLSAVSSSSPIMNIMIMTVSGLSIGVAIVIGSHLGGSNPEKPVKSCANTAITFYLLLSLVVTVLGSFLTPFLITLVKTPPEAVSGAISYLRIIFFGTVFLFGYNLIAAFQQGFGDSKTPLYLVLTGTVINIILDYLLIGVWDMGPQGAAIATVAAQAVTLAAGIAYFRIKKHLITFSPREFKINKIQMGLIIHMGLPAAIQQFLINVSNTTLMGVANSFGVAASAAYGVAVKLDSFARLPIDAIGLGVSPFASQNVGAGKPERALKGLKEAVKLAEIFAVLSIVLFLTLAPFLSSIFDSNPQVIAYSAGYLRIVCFANLIFAMVTPMIGFVRGTGNSIFTLIAVVVAQYFIRIPVSLLCTKLIGFNGLAIGTILAVCSALMIYCYAILTNRWMKSKEVLRSKEMLSKCQ